ncbi:MAG: acyl-CoA dehydrogenase family protein [Acidimicrobiales bacterium]
MDLLPSPEQQEIVAAAAAFLGRELPVSRIREMRTHASSVDRAAWARCADLGWFGLGLPEALGGVGYGLIEEALLFRELGRHVAPGPFLPTVIGARVAAVAGETDMAKDILSGHAVVALAEARDPSGVTPGGLVGTFDLFDAVDAEFAAVVTPSGCALVAMDAVGEVAALPCIDPGVRLGRVELAGTPPAVHVATEVEPLFLRAAVLVSAMLAGIAETTCQMAAEYAKVRVQFGKPIGVHQAIKHRCADMAVRAEAAGSQMAFAALSVDEDRHDAPFQVTAARIVATDAAIRNAADNIQVHGGMGYTFEHDAHLYVKRAHVLDRIGGDVRRHLARLVDLPGAQ